MSLGVRSADEDTEILRRMLNATTDELVFKPTKVVDGKVVPA